MFLSRFVPVLLVAAIAVGNFGCSASQSPNTTPQGYKMTPNNMLKQVEKNVLPPKQLTALNLNALGIMNDVNKKDWTSAKSRMNQIRTDYNQLRPLMQASSVPSAKITSVRKAIDGLEKQIAAKNAYETKLGANKLTKVLPDVTDMYGTTVPSDLNRLGYLGREISLNVEKNDWKDAGINYKNAMTMWTSLTKKMGLNSNINSVNYSTSLGNMGKAITSKSAASVQMGTKGLSDALSSLESYFNNLGKGK
jgi:hypothetical protein